MNDRSPWVLVLDVGSSSVKVWLYDAGGRGVEPGGGAQLLYNWHTSDGAMEVPANRLFDLVVHALDTAVAFARQKDIKVGAIAITTFWHSILGVSSTGEPLTPVYAWGDTRAAETARRLAGVVDESDMHRRTGCFLHPSYPVVKLVWLKELDPADFERVSQWVSIGEYIEHRLFGSMRCSYSMASGTGLLDIHRLEWDAEMLELVGLSADSFPPLVDTDATLTGLRAEFAGRWPELASTPWFPALGDGACANVGSGALGKDLQGVTVGTSAAVRTLWETDEVTVPDTLWCYRLDGRRVVAGGALSNGGNAVAYLENTLRLPAGEAWDAELLGVTPDSHGLTVLPFLVGERGPNWLRETSAAVVGLCHTTPPLHLLRAWLEAIAYQIAEISSALQDSYGPPSQVLASGGALHASPVWTQIIADVIDCPVSMSIEREATAHGAALVAQERLGLLSSLDLARSTRAADVRPDPDRHAIYMDAIDRQRRLAEALTSRP